MACDCRASGGTSVLAQNAGKDTEATKDLQTKLQDIQPFRAPSDELCDNGECTAEFACWEGESSNM